MTMSQPVIKIKRMVNGDFHMPIKGNEHAACYDVYAHSMRFADNKVYIGLGFATEIPVGWKGIIVPRSNLTKHNWVMNNSFGVIDSDYRGEWIFVLTSISDDTLANPLPYTVGNRVAQIKFEPVYDVTFELTEELAGSVRGQGGFGSTGTDNVEARFNPKFK